AQPAECRDGGDHRWNKWCRRPEEGGPEIRVRPLRLLNQQGSPRGCLKRLPLGTGNTQRDKRVKLPGLSNFRLAHVSDIMPLGMDSNSILDSIFDVPRALIGVIHVDALPGTPANRRHVAAIAEGAVDEARIYHTTGFHGLVIENTHDRPYLKSTVGPEIGTAMAVIGAEIRRAVSLPLG